jgi:hypothetical protein
MIARTEDVFRLQMNLHRQRVLPLRHMGVMVVTTTGSGI